MPFYEILGKPTMDILERVASHGADHKGTVAIVAFSFLVYYIKEHLLKPPKHLRHIPLRFSITETLKSLLITGDSLIEQREKEIMPFVNSATPDDAYLTLTGIGWVVHVTTSDIAKRIVKLYRLPNSTEGFEHLLILKFIAGPNLLSVSGKQWKHQRMVANPAFHRNMPVHLFGKLSQDVFSLIDASIDEKVDFSSLMKRFTLEAIGKAGFDFDFHALKSTQSKWISIYEQVNKGFLDPTFYVLPLLFPIIEKDFGLNFFPKRKELHQKLAQFLGMLDEVIKAKKDKVLQGDVQNNELAENEKDILTLMIENELQGEGGLTNEELKANLCAFFFAGHDTTASVLCSAVYYLAINPEIQSKARQEAISVFGDEPHDVLPTIAETKNLPYIDQVIKETLRIAAPVIDMACRKISEDYLVGSTIIPKGTKVQIDVYGIHHNEKVWENPYKFDPERFSKQNEGSLWLPFGGGPNACIGMNFSLNEQRVLLCMLLRKYTWTLPEDSIHKNGLLFDGAIAMSPKTLHINFQRIY